ncbi:MAG TPA: NUDIX hydrolase [Streptosporangiaceae bacterium]|nr:NUDIX hydrolase [Streptosporangiaceae bacterium]
MLPTALAARVRAAVEAGTPPMEPRDSATVMLLRPSIGGPGIEVYMLRRRRSMSFAAGAYAYPGGSVDSRDTDAGISWTGPDVTQWAGWLGATPELARGLVCAAVRETFEESGVLLAGASARDTNVPPPAVLEPDRLSLLGRSLSLAGLLAKHRLVLRSDLLKPWARWVTPELEGRRYDTRFFAAVLPDGQHPWEIRDEADELAWLTPATVLAAAANGEATLMPPTAVTLSELAACADPPAALATPRHITPLRPQIRLEDDGAWLYMPPGVEYPL